MRLRRLALWSLAALCLGGAAHAASQIEESQGQAYAVLQGDGLQQSQGQAYAVLTPTLAVSQEQGYALLCAPAGIGACPIAIGAPLPYRRWPGSRMGR